MPGYAAAIRAGAGWKVNRTDADLAVRTAFDAWVFEFGDQLLVDTTTGRSRSAAAFDMRAKLPE